MDEKYPTFDESVRQFREFLLLQGWPSTIVWVRPEDVLWVKQRVGVRLNPAAIGEAHARQVYSRSVTARLGVSLDAIGRDGKCTFARVIRPLSGDAASRRMFPDGLKLSLPKESPQVTVVSNRINWWSWLATADRRRDVDGDIEG